MEQYINKSALVAEIKRRYEFHKERNRKEDSAIQDVLYGILKFLNTLETKGVDLEKEYEKYVMDGPIFGNFIANDTMGMKLAKYFIGMKLAKHFFELGLKVKEK